VAKAGIPLHSEIPVQYTWNAPSVFASGDEWEAEFKRVSKFVVEAAKYQSHLADGASTLAEALAARDEVLRRVSILMVYAEMAGAVDSNDQAAASMASRSRGLLGQALAAYSFVDPELIAIGKDTLDRWLKDEARLAIYAHYIDNLFRKQTHVRSAEVEEVLGMLADPFGSTTMTEHTLTDADFKFASARSSDGAELPLTQGTWLKLMADADREVRRTAWESYSEVYLAHQNTLANNLITSIKQNVFKMRARRHHSTLEMALSEENIPIEVFYNLIDTFRKNIPTWHRYWAVRRKALGVATLRYYDTWAPLTTKRPHVTYEQAVDWICAGLAPMSDEYVSVVRKGCLEDRWVDVYPNRGKGAGAFSTGALGTHPFIMMSYSESLMSLSTLAHELGHSMHSYLTFQTQPFVYSNYSTFVAEVASNFHQAMVRAHLLKANPDPDFQLALIEEAMGNFHRYFFIMPTLARFELEVHERIERGEGVTADTLIDRMVELFSEGYGGQMEIDHDRQGIIWSTFGHLYADYYVFQYATGISGANALAKRILSGVPHAAEDYVRFLKAGGSMYALDALKVAGVDLTTPQPVEAAFEVLAGLVDRLEQLIG
jgi:oligoendopeptidase F